VITFQLIPLYEEREILRDKASSVVKLVDMLSSGEVV